MMVVLAFRGTSADWTNGETRISRSSTKANAKFLAENELGFLTDNMLLQQRSPKGPWATLEKALPAYQRR